jgi:hypothetical protein
MRASIPLTTERGRLRVAFAALCAAALVAVIAALAPAPAHAAFTLGKCQGGEITGEGSSLQKLAQKDWQSKIFDSETNNPECEHPPVVNYKTASSGCGLDAVGAGVEASGCEFTGDKAEWEKPGYRDGLVRFSAADFAPTPEQEKNIDDGPNGAGQPGAGEIHVIPVAGAAITVIVHFPEGCALQNPEAGNGDTSTGGSNDPAGAATEDKFSNQTLRVHIKDQVLEEIWQGKIKTWGEIIPQADFLSNAVTPGVSKTQAECADTQIIRIVREDTSGTTYNFKHFLALLPFTSGGGSALWTSSSSEVGSKNTAWPLASGTGVPADVNGTTNVCESSEHICHAAAGKGSSLALAVKDNNGAIGYLDLATAREEGFNMTPNPTGEPGQSGFKETDNDRLYWVPLETVEPPASESQVGKVDTGVFVEPTAIAKSHLSTSVEAENGANCEGADWRNIPSKSSSPNEDPTLGDWSKAIATGGTKSAIEKHPTTAYPVCAITYDFAFDDDAAVYGNTAKEEAQARTVKDYLTAVVSNAGQLTKLTLFDYATLPLEVINDAEKGVEAIGWNKSAGAGSSNNSSNNNTPTNNSNSSSSSGGSTTGTTSSPPPNAFSIAGTKVKGKDIVLSLVLPGAGKVQVKATGGGVTVSSLSASVSGGQGTVTLPISSAAIKKIGKAKGKKLAVTITVTFTPNGGTAASKTEKITVTQASITTKKKSSKKGKKK